MAEPGTWAAWGQKEGGGRPGDDRASDLLAALREIERLRLATNEGSLRVRADRMWEIATAAIARHE